METKVYFKRIERKIIENLESATFSINIAVAWLTSPAIIKTISNCLSRGVKVKLVSVNDKINGVSVFSKLYYEGAEIRLLSKKLMHNKFCIIDNSIVITGSYNWTVNAKRNHENITISKGDIAVIEAFSEEFQKIWKNGKDISLIIPINKAKITEIEEEFNTFFEKIRSICSPPYIYVIKNDIMNYKHPSMKKYHGNIEKGYYLISSEEDEYSFLRNLFFSKLDSFSKLNQAIEIPKVIEKTTIQRVFVPFFLTTFKHSFNNLIPLKGSLWIDYYEVSTRFISKIETNGETSSEKHKVIANFKDSYLISVDDKMMIFINGKFIEIDYLNKYKPMLNRKMRFLDENYFFCSFSFGESELKKFAIFNIQGKMLSYPIFYSSSIKKVENYYLIEETPVLFYDSKGAVSTVLKNNFRSNNYRIISNTTKQIWQFQNGTFSKKNDVEINHVDLKHTHKALFINDEEYGPLYLALALVKNYLKKEQLENAKQIYNKRYPYKNNFLQKFDSGKRVALEIIKLEKEEHERIVAVNKFMEDFKAKPDHCFVATAIYGNINHPKTKDFRKFRDKYLISLPLGCTIVDSYYAIAPFYVRLLKRSSVLSKATRFFLFFIHFFIKRFL